MPDLHDQSERARLRAMHVATKWALTEHLLAALDLIDEQAAELVECYVSILAAAGALISEGDFAGWYDTCAMTDAMMAGDRLVELGLWERHPQGFGRHWFYRRKQNACAAKETSDAR